MPNQINPAVGGREKLWNKFFILAFLSNLFLCFAMMMINSTMAKYIYSLYGNAAFSGILNASFAVLAIAARLVSGYLADSRGRMKVMLLGAAVFAVSAFCFGVFPYAALLIVFRALHGFGYATATTATYAASADILPERRMSEGIGYIMLGYCIAIAIGSAIALSLVVGDDYSMVFYVSTGMIVVAIIITSFLRYEKLPFYQNKIKGQKQKSETVDLSAYSGIRKFIEFKAMPAALVQLFNSTSFAAVNFFIVIYADSKGISGTAAFFTTMAVGMTFTRFFSGRLSDKYGELLVVAGAIILQTIALILLINVSGNLPFYAVGFFVGMAFGTVSPVLQAAAIKKSPVNRRGAASGTFQISSDLAQGAGAIIWGVVIDSMGFTSAFVGCIICGLIAFAALLLFFNRRVSPR